MADAVRGLFLKMLLSGDTLAENQCKRRLFECRPILSAAVLTAGWLARFQGHVLLRYMVPNLTEGLVEVCKAEAAE